MNNQHKLSFSEEVVIVNRQLTTAKECWFFRRHFTIEEKQDWRDQMSLLASQRSRVYDGHQNFT